MEIIRTVIDSSNLVRYRSVSDVFAMLLQHSYSLGTENVRHFDGWKLILCFSSREEIGLIRLKNLILTTFSALIYSCQPIASCIGIVILALSGVELTTFNMMMTLSLISTIRMSISQKIASPMHVLADTFAGFARIQDFLEIEELQQLTAIDALQRSFGTIDRQQTVVANRNILHIENITCHVGGEVALKDIRLSASEGELVFVAGPVGSGKSSLLMAILEELPLTQGTISCSGKIAHVPQLAWIFTGTVRENILFGRPMQYQRYKSVLEACALTTDMENFPDGDMTMIGERGVVLSGGQRSRVDLARAVYANADVYLLDDPLSAVDAKVGRILFEKCICGLLAHKTRIVVTHCQQYLINAQRIIIMDGGSMSHDGSYAELCDAGVRFHDMTEGSVTESRSHIRDVPKRDVVMETATGLELDDEDRSTGSVTWQTYWQYFRAAMSRFSLACFALFFVLAQGTVGRGGGGG